MPEIRKNGVTYAGPAEVGTGIDVTQNSDGNTVINFDSVGAGVPTGTGAGSTWSFTIKPDGSVLIDAVGNQFANGFSYLYTTSLPFPSSPSGHKVVALTGNVAHFTLENLGNTNPRILTSTETLYVTGWFWTNAGCTTGQSAPIPFQISRQSQNPIDMNITVDVSGTNVATVHATLVDPDNTISGVTNPVQFAVSTDNGVTYGSLQNPTSTVGATRNYQFSITDLTKIYFVRVVLTYKDNTQTNQNKEFIVQVDPAKIPTVIASAQLNREKKVLLFGGFSPAVQSLKYAIAVANIDNTTAYPTAATVRSSGTLYNIPSGDTGFYITTSQLLNPGQTAYISILSYSQTSAGGVESQLYTTSFQRNPNEMPGGSFDIIVKSDGFVDLQFTGNQYAAGIRYKVSKSAYQTSPTGATLVTNIAVRTLCADCPDTYVQGGDSNVIQLLGTDETVYVTAWFWDTTAATGTMGPLVQASAQGTDLRPRGEIQLYSGAGGHAKLQVWGYGNARSVGYKFTTLPPGSPILDTSYPADTTAGLTYANLVDEAGNPALNGKKEIDLGTAANGDIILARAFIFSLTGGSGYQSPVSYTSQLALKYLPTEGIREVSVKPSQFYLGGWSEVSFKIFDGQNRGGQLKITVPANWNAVPTVEYTTTLTAGTTAAGALIDKTVLTALGQVQGSASYPSFMYVEFTPVENSINMPGTGKQRIEIRGINSSITDDGQINRTIPYGDSTQTPGETDADAAAGRSGVGNEPNNLIFNGGGQQGLTPWVSRTVSSTLSTPSDAYKLGDRAFKMWHPTGKYQLAFSNKLISTTALSWANTGQFTVQFGLYVPSAPPLSPALILADDFFEIWLVNVSAGVYAPRVGINTSNGMEYQNLIGAEIRLGFWQEITISYNSKNIYATIDGDFKKSVAHTTGGPLNAGVGTNHGFTITSGQTGPWNFSIDDVRLWSKALTATEVRAGMGLELAGTETGLVSNWKMNEGTGTSVGNSVSGKPALTGSGGTMPTWVQTRIDDEQWSQDYLVKDKDVIAITGWIKADSLSGSGEGALLRTAILSGVTSLTVYELETTGTAFTGTDICTGIRTASGTVDWTFVKAVVRVAGAGSLRTTMQLGKGALVNGTAWFDGIRVERLANYVYNEAEVGRKGVGEAPDNLLANGGGQVDAVGKVDPTSWTYVQGNHVTVDNAQSKFGDRSFQLPAHASVVAVTYQNVAVSSGDIYEITGWLMSTSTTGYTALEIGGLSFTQLEKQSPYQAGNQVGIPAGSNSWTFVRNVVRMNAAGTLQLSLVQATGTGTAWFDGLNVVKLQTYTTNEAETGRKAAGNDPENQLANPTAQNDPAPTATTPTGWTAAGGNTFSTDNTNFKFGDRSFKVIANAGSISGIRQTFTVALNDVYEFSGWVMTTSTSSYAGLFLNPGTGAFTVLESSPASVATNTVGVAAGSNAWTFMRMVVRVTTAGTVFPHLVLNTGSGTAWFDGALFKKIQSYTTNEAETGRKNAGTDPDSLLTNGGGQADAVGSTASAWVLRLGNAFIVDNTYAKFGDRSLKNVQSGGGASYSHQTFTVAAGDIYEFTGWIHAPSGLGGGAVLQPEVASGAAFIGLEVNGLLTANTTTDVYAGINSTTSEFQFCRVIIKVTAAGTIRFSIATGTGSSSIWFDGLTLRKLDTYNQITAETSKQGLLFETFEHYQTKQWIDESGGAAPTLSIVPNAGYSGGNVLRVVNQALMYYNVKQPYDPSKMHKVRFRVRQHTDPTAGSKSIYLGVTLWNNAGTRLTAAGGGNALYCAALLATPTQSTSAWVEYTGYFKGLGGTTNAEAPDPKNPIALPAGTAYISPYIVANYVGGNGIFEVDSISIMVMDEDVKIDSITGREDVGNNPHNLIVNGGGQSDPVGYTASSWNYGTGNVMTVTNAASKYGDRSLTITNPSATHSYHSQTFSILAGEYYMFEGWIKTASITAQAMLQTVVISGSITTLEFSAEYSAASGGVTDIGLSTATKDWTRVYVIYKCLTNAVVNLYCRLGYSATSTGTVYFDGVSFRRVTASEVSAVAFDGVENLGFATHTVRREALANALFYGG